MGGGRIVGMGVDLLTRRQAVLEWRDRQTFELIEMLSRAAVDAQLALDRQIKEAEILGSIWEPARFVNARIDAAMHDFLANRCPKLHHDAALELEYLDSAFKPLGEAFLEAAQAVELPNSMDGDVLPSEPVEHGPQSEQSFRRLGKLKRRAAGAFSYVGGLPVAKSILKFGGRAADGVSVAADSLSQTLQDSAGLHGRLRKAGEVRLGEAWLGMDGSNKSYLANSVEVIDEVANVARSMSL